MNVIFPLEGKWVGWIDGEHKQVEPELLLEDVVVEAERTSNSIMKYASENQLVPEGANAIWIKPEHEVLEIPKNYQEELALLRMRVNFYRV